MENTTEEIIRNVRTKDVKVGDRIHQHGGGERTVIETRYYDGGKCADTVMLATVDNADGTVDHHFYPVTSRHFPGGFYKVPTIVTEEVK